MKTKKLMALLVAGTMMSSMLNVSALYSENVELIENPQPKGGTLKWVGTLDSNAPKTLFKVGGQTFSLLDTDEDGNFFVMTEKYFGSHAWWDEMHFDRTLTKATATGETDDAGNAVYEAFVADYNDIDMDKVRWNPDMPGTVGYWLNNDFFNSANLPTDIKNNIIEYEWQNEAINTAPSGMQWNSDNEVRKLVSYGEGKTFYTEILSRINLQPYTTTSKLALISASEYNAYKDKVGIQSPVGGWQGMMTRTVSAFGASKWNGSVALPESYLAISPIQMHGVADSTSATDVNKASVDHNYNPTASYYHIRPVFWLDKDFFENVKIEDAVNSGSDVTSILKSMDYYTLSLAGYTDEEIEALGVELGIGQPKPDINPMEGFGNYPEHEVFGHIANRGNITWEGTDNEKFSFSVALDDTKSKSFVLLDRDEEGNYLVLAQNEYGAYKFHTVDEQEGLSKYNVKASDWDYDVEDTGSIAYYLENGFMAEGGQGRNIPESMRNNILGIKEGTAKPTWQVENDFVHDTAKSGNITSTITKTQYEEWLAGRETQVREFNASVVLPSYTELKTYQSKIKANYTGWTSPIMRSVQSSAVLNSDGSITYGVNFFRYYTKNNQDAISYDGEIDNWVYSGNHYVIRPMFWLDKDFFKNEKVEILKTTEEGTSVVIGSEVAKQILQYNIADVKDLYTEDELEVIGYTNLPAVNGLAIRGTIATGKTLEAGYTFAEGVPGATEKGTVYQWYIEDENGEYKAIEGATEKTYVIKAEDLDKNIKVEVIPKDILNSIGERVSATRFLEEVELLVVEDDAWFLDADDIALDTLNGEKYINAEYEITNNDSVAVTKTFILAVYNSEGAMVQVNSTDVEIAPGTDLYYVDITLDKACGTGYTCKAMIWDTLAGMVPVYVTEF